MAIVEELLASFFGDGGLFLDTVVFSPRRATTTRLNESTYTLASKYASYGHHRRGPGVMAQPPAIEKLLLAVSRRGRVIVRFSGKGCGGKSRPSTSRLLRFQTHLVVCVRSLILPPMFGLSLLRRDRFDRQATSRHKAAGGSEVFRRPSFLLLLILLRALLHLVRLPPLLCVN